MVNDQLSIMNGKTPLPPLSLYIHIPWCLRKCPYCDFNSHTAYNTLPESEYVRALIADLHADSHYAAGRKLQSVFFGGGTPSLFSSQSIAAVLSAAETCIGFADDVEITLEANPGTAEQGKFSGFRQAGVNRLSIGVQSFHPRSLELLGRVHSAGEALRAVDMARRAGFENFNIDLMHGLPGQTPENALADLDQAIGLEPPHLSWYQLTIEPNTAFFSRPPALPVEDTLLDIQEQGLARLTAAGYRQYEISAYTRGGYPSKHNLNYWEFGDYLGIGAGAHAKVTLSANGPTTGDAEKSSIRRLRKTRQPNHYLANQYLVEGTKRFSAGAQWLQADELALEFMMNALRLADGVPAALFNERTGLPLSTILPKLTRLQERGLMAKAPQRLQTTPLGYRFLNTVLEEFMPE